MSSPSQYRYTAIENDSQIRLLRLQPGPEPDPIQISIFSADLNSDAKYEALSYTWGDPSATCLILCSEESDTLSITQNCEAALRRLRSTTQERTLWIDAICIDQMNIPERGQQVQLMSRLYRQAQRVLAYLGEASIDSHIGVEFIIQDVKMLSSAENRPPVGLGPSSPSSPQQVSIDNILNREYFKRIWILQEIVFAREILIFVGGQTVDWNDFSRTVYYVDMNKKMYLGSKYEKKPPSAVFYRERSESLAGGTQSSDMPQSLLELLRDTRHCQSTDPRDKIHALLGMSTEKDEPALAPDYSLTVQQTFTNLTRFLIDRDKRVDILSHAQGYRSNQNLPSWVPDWSCQLVAEIIGHVKDSIRPYKASLNASANVSFQEGPETMIVEGKVLDTVSRVGPVYEMGSDSSTLALQQWEAIASTWKSDHYLDTSAVFIDTLVAYPPYAKANAFGMFYQSWRRLTIGREDLGQHERAEATIFQDRVTKASSGRALFGTEKGYLGLGPAEMQVGDRVAVLLGGSVPFILRVQQSHFKLVGECYIRGLMNGEAIEDRTIDFQMIHIR